MTTGTHLPPRVARLLALMLVVGGAVLLYWPTLQSFADLWSDDDNPTYGHGWLLLAVSVWLLWSRRVELLRSDAQQPRRIWVIGNWALLAASVLLWQLMYRAGVQVGYLFMWPLVIFAAIGAAIGPRAALASVPALLLLYFAIPFWDAFNAPAQWATVYAVRSMLRLVGVPAYFEGNMVQIPSGSFAIEGGCSGLHFLIVGLAIATLIGELRRDDWRGRLKWWALALLLAILTNWSRVFIVILAGHLTHMQSYLVRVSHYGFGWAVFAVALAIMLLIERRTPLPPVVERAAPESVSGRRNATWAAVAAVLLVIAVPAAANLSIKTRTNVGQVSYRAALQGWQTLADSEMSWKPEQTLADGTRLQRYAKRGETVDVYLAWYREQRQRKKLGGYANRLQGNDDIMSFGTAATRNSTFGTLHTRAPDQKESLIWYQYRVGGRTFSSATRAQLWYSWQTMLGIKTPVSQVLAVRMLCDTDCRVAAGKLQDIAAQIRVVP